MELKFKVDARIAKPVAEVFEAVVNPSELSRYFTTGGAKGTTSKPAQRSLGTSTIFPAHFRSKWWRWRRTGGSCSAGPRTRERPPMARRP